MAKKSEKMTENPENITKAVDLEYAATLPKVRINAEKVKIPVFGGWAIARRGDIIEEPTPQLLKMAQNDKQNRVFTIIS
jgi:hypothetical protein